MKKNFTAGLGKSVEADRAKLSRRRRQILRELGLSEELDSTELAERLLVQAKTNRTLVKTLEEKDRELARMDLILSVCDSEIKVKEARIAELASRVAEFGGSRKSGGQKGHSGSTLLQSANVTETRQWYPVSVCPGRGKPLEMNSAIVCATRQVVDIPLPIAATVVNHMTMQVKCSCGHCCKGEFPEEVNALVSNMLKAMRKFSKTPYEMIRQKVAGGKVAGADETGINVNGKNNWLWAFQNAIATFLAFDSSRSHHVINKHFTGEEQGNKVWVTDRLPAYFMGDVGTGGSPDMYCPSVAEPHLHDAGLSG